MIHWLNLLPLLVIFAGCVAFLVADKKEAVFAGLGAIALAEFLVGIQFGSVLSAGIRLLALLSSLLAIYISLREQSSDFVAIERDAANFRIVAFLILLVLAVLVGIKVSDYLNVALEIILAGLFSIFCGILQLGISTSPRRVILGIILLFSGFGGIYNIIETSLLMNGMLSAVILLLGVLGTYFIIRDVRGEEE
jgi:hypothetical protein